MSDGHPLYPQAKIISLTYVSNPTGLEKIDVEMTYTVVEEPANATPADLHLASQPQFYTDSERNFFLKLTLSNGQINRQVASDKGTAVFTTVAASGDNVEVYFKCEWEGNSAMPPSNQIFMIKVVSPAAESGGTKKELKWAFKKTGK